MLPSLTNRPSTGAAKITIAKKPKVKKVAQTPQGEEKQEAKKIEDKEANDEEEDTKPEESNQEGDPLEALRTAGNILGYGGKRKLLGGNLEVAPGLYVVATPVGNMSDISLRAIHVLNEADVICCEDTRVTRNMLTRLNILKEKSHAVKHKGKVDLFSSKTGTTRAEDDESRETTETPKRLISFHKYSHPRKIESIIQSLKNGGIKVAIVSDAGTPLISDPGANLVEEAHRAKVPVYCIPGPSLPCSALSVSGFPSDRFTFEGFLPKQPGKKLTTLKKLAKQDRTVVLFESPFRVEKTLAACIEVYGVDHQAAIIREMTKIHEEVVRDTLSNLLEHAKKKTKGEYTLVIGPRTQTKELMEKERK